MGRFKLGCSARRPKKLPGSYVLQTTVQFTGNESLTALRTFRHAHQYLAQPLPDGSSFFDTARGPPVVSFTKVLSPTQSPQKKSIVLGLSPESRSAR
jgi:hypothetical protein